MSHSIDKMLELTADIADALLLIKDKGEQTVPDSLKLKILNLVELASSMPEESEAASEEEINSAEFEEEADADVSEPADADVSNPNEDETPREEPSDNDPEEPSETDPEEAAEEAETAAIEKVAEADDTPREDDATSADDADVVEAVLEEEEAEADTHEASVDTPDADADTGVEETPEDERMADERAGSETEEIMPVTVPKEQDDAPQQPRLSVAELVHSFSINDLFLFRREIFHGDKMAFDSALGDIATLGADRRCLQHYLVESLHLNLNENPGKDFYESLLSFFD